MVCDKNKCTGCYACYNICPKNAIKMIEDDNGFIYPSIYKEKCIDCNLCKKVCPAINKMKYNFPKICYAAQRKDKIKLKESSSGGVASVLAEEFVVNNGVVYAAIFEKGFKFHYTRIDSLNDLCKMRGSKYVHCYVEDAYKKIKGDLLEKKEVLFIGTPCQVAGLKTFLMKDYDNLYCVDLICHGVPSLKYLKDELSSEIDINNITGLKFRENNEYKIVAKNNKKIVFSKRIKNSKYYQGFMDGFFNRENCYDCKFARSDRISDLTIGDFWGLGQDSSFYEKREEGVSVILVCTKKGEKILSNCSESLNLEKRDIEEAVNGNTQLRHPVKKDKNYDKFKKLYPKYGFDKAYNKTRYIAILKSVLQRNKLVLWLYLKIRGVLEK